LAKIHLDRLRKRHGYVGEPYRALMRKIIAANTEEIAGAIGRITDDNFKRKMTTYRPGREKLFVLPDIREALPKQAVFIRKGATRGDLLSDDLRDSLAQNLRAVLEKPEYVVARGTYAGRMKQAVLADFEKAIKKTFRGYVRRDPAVGMPTNLYAIATTETRSVVDQVKHGYVQEIRRRNSAIYVKKRWIHNMSLLKDRKNARQHHVALNGVTIGFNRDFVIHDKNTGTTYLAPHPHHESLPAEEVISCQCELVYIIGKD